jgi:formylglycine-generating enzyme required for sulfatase activity/serine/threonine protein phosphatase PrpC
MELYFEVAASQSAGTNQRPQGAHLSAYLDDEQGAGNKSTMLIVMADGTGSRVGGRIASNMVVATFNKSVVRRLGAGALDELLRSSVLAANGALGEAIDETESLSGMACTLIGVMLIRNRLHWISVGDSHLALIRDGTLRRLNEDHSYGAYLARLRAQGIDIEPEPGITPDMLMSAMTGADIDEMDCPPGGVELRDGDRLILASQGVGAVGEAPILEACTRASSAEEAVAALLRVPPAPGVERREEATAIVIDVFDRDPQPVAERAAGVAAKETVGADRRRRKARLIDVAVMVAAVLIFAGTAAGTWYGLGRVNELRQARPPAVASTPVAIEAIPTPAPPGAAGAPPGLSFGAPPSGPAAPAGAPAPPGASEPTLSFGTPAPLPDTAAPPDTAPATAQQGLRDPLAVGGDGPLMLPIPAGKFEMGNAGASPRGEERPRRSVSVAAFALGKFEVTVAQYQQFASDTGRRMPALDTHDPENTPVSRVSWNDAYAYTVWLSRQTGQRYRLPSEAEWEYAASVGARSTYWWGQDLGENRAHCFDCGTGLDPRRPTQVGRFAANAFGLHDTAGNVAEWVHECWHPNYRDAPNDASVWEGGDCTLRVARGGGFDSPAQSIRPRARVAAPATRPRDSIGFRVARDLP